MSSPFPLLRLPRLVLFEVFKSLSIGEKIELSLCSTKICTQINNAQFYSQKVIVYLDILTRKIEVHSENNKDTFDIFMYPDFWRSHNSNTQQLSLARCTVPVISHTKGTSSFWKSHREGYLSAIRHLLKMFQCKISINIKHYSSGLYGATISLLFDLQVEFKKLSISFNGSEDQNLLWNQISNKLVLVEDLIITSTFNTGFKPVFITWPQKIDIFNSYWFTLEYLLSCTSSTITLKWSDLGTEDLDEVLRKWKAGGFPNLKYLRVDSQGITNNGTTILGMSPSKLDGKVIQTNDGLRKATINTGSDLRHMFLEMSIYSR